MVEIVKKRIDWIDTAKGIGTLCIIFSHISLYNYPSKFVMFLFGFEVALFFILSGILFKRKLDANFSTLIKDAIKNYVVPYLVCAVIIVVYRRLLLGNSIVDDFNAFLIQQRSGALWFIPVMVCCQFTCWAIHNISKNKKIQAIIIGALSIIGLCYMHFYTKALMWNLDLVPYCSLYVYIGIVASDKLLSLELSTKNRFILFVVGVVFGIIANFGIQYNFYSQEEWYYITITNFHIAPIAIATALLGSFAVIFVSMALPVFKPLSFLGKKSFSFIAFNNDIASNFITLIPVIEATFRTDYYYRNILVFALYNLLIPLLLYPLYDCLRKLLLSGLRKINQNQISSQTDKI